MDRFEDIMMAAFMLIFALLGIIEIIGFQNGHELPSIR